MISGYRTVSPTIAATAYVDASAQVIGDVHVGEESSIWMNAVVRGDVNVIRIGNRTNIQDGVIVHVMRDPSHQTKLGDDITVGHGAIIHGCTIEHACLIGMGAILLNGVKVGSDSIVAAGSLVPEGFVVPPRSLVMGNPAKLRRELTDADAAAIRVYAANYVANRLDYT
jgi:carbonic anhydrase/acetyltransferase-like protein (isoleucine patch superfamily)